MRVSFSTYLASLSPVPLTPISWSLLFMACIIHKWRHFFPLFTAMCLPISLPPPPSLPYPFLPSFNLAPTSCFHYNDFFTCQLSYSSYFFLQIYPQELYCSKCHFCSREGRLYRGKLKLLLSEWKIPCWDLAEKFKTIQLWLR